MLHNKSATTTTRTNQQQWPWTMRINHRLDGLRLPWRWCYLFVKWIIKTKKNLCAQSCEWYIIINSTPNNQNTQSQRHDIYNNGFVSSTAIVVIVDVIVTRWGPLQSQADNRFNDFFIIETYFLFCSPRLLPLLCVCLFIVVRLHFVLLVFHLFHFAYIHKGVRRSVCLCVPVYIYRRYTLLVAFHPFAMGVR